MLRLEAEIKKLQSCFKTSFTAPSLSSLLKLSRGELHCLIALNIAGEAHAADIAKIVGISRAMASAHLNTLCRVGLAEKTKVGRRCFFKPLFKIKEG